MAGMKVVGINKF